MRKIAVTQRLIKNDSYYEIREALDIRYCRLIKACGFLPIILPYEVDIDLYFKELDIDGILLTGGNDLYSCNKNELSYKRDKFEKKLLSLAIVKDIPVFGICRGMQLIAEYFGSTLKSIHSEIKNKHSLILKEESLYNNYLNKLETVNSYHGFAIDVLAKELLISAKKENGIIKAIEHKRYKIFGQMWHSERENPFNQDEIELIKAIL